MKDKLKLVKELIRIQVAKILTEAKGVTQLKSDYDDAIKKEQALSSLMLMNLVKYKQAKASADEKAIAKFTKIAGQLSPKKKKASELANKAYQAYEDMISGMHADVELEIDEGRLTEVQAMNMDTVPYNTIMKMKPGSTIKMKDGKIRTKDKFGNWRADTDPNDIIANRDVIKHMKGMKGFNIGNGRVRIEGKLTEANRSKVFRAAKKGSYPAVIVVVQNGKVIHQEPVSTPEVAPATFNVMQEKYPKAQLHLEDRTGKRLFSESVVTEGISFSPTIEFSIRKYEKTPDGKHDSYITTNSHPAPNALRK